MFACKYCNKSFSRKYNVNCHERAVHEEIKFVWNFCKESFNHRNTLKCHEKTVQENVKFNCTECGKQYKVKFHLDEYIRSVHDESKHQKKKYSCVLCSKRFSLMSLLKNHEISVLCAFQEGIKNFSKYFDTVYKKIFWLCLIM